MRVGTKELKNKLSYYVRAARAGEHVEITDRGAVVAELRGVTPKSDGDAAALERLAEEGIVSMGSGRAGDFMPVKLRRRGVRASAYVIDDRR